MALEKINITETVDKARGLLESERDISPGLKAMIEMLLMIVILFAERFGLNSKNSSKPPSTDLNRKKKKKASTNKKAGGQPGRVGVNLEPVSEPDVIIPLKLDKRRLPKGEYREVGFESRQVVDIEISRIVT